MVAAAFATLALSRELSPLVVFATCTFGLGSFFAEPSRYAFLRGKTWIGLWNAATLIAFSWTILDALRGEALFAGVRFLCFLVINKLYNRRASRDYLQAYVISFLMLVAGAALSTDLAYAGCFLLYVVFATWTLTLFHLRREMEENYLLKHSDGALSERVEVDRILNSRRIVGASFLAGTSLVSLGIFLFATLVFFLIPRFGFGFFVSRSRHSTLTMGFQDNVSIDYTGKVRDNPQVVMRVELPDGPPAIALRFRGVSFDRYQGGRWARTAAIAPAPLKRWDQLWLTDGQRPTAARVRELMATARKQIVYLDPLDTPLIFGASMPLAFELTQPRGLGPSPIELEGRGAGEVAAVERHVEAATGRVYTGERKSGLRYVVWSDEPHPSVQALASETPARAPELEPYLVVPDLPPRIAELAKKITSGARTPYAKALALEKYLQTHYPYTLELKHDDRYEPLDEFLFVTRAGDCAYFATAMAVMLRQVGVPTRQVNGFLGGEWNQYGHYLAVRQGDAHSWVEVYIEGAGWMTFDPTPVGPPRDHGGALARIRQLYDTMEMAWFKYVIEYDLSKQVDAFAGIRKWAEKILRKQPLVIAGVGLAVAFVASWLARRLKRKRGAAAAARTPRAAQRAHHAFERALAALERRGHPRAPAETGRELAVRVERAGDPGAAPFASLVELYYAARFGGVAVPPTELDRLAGEVQRPPRRAQV